MTTKPTIELKSIEISASLSEETPAYTAKLFVDGKHFADVSNHGHGGPDNYHFVGGNTWDSFKALEERVKATYPKTKYGDMELEQSVECLCHGIAFRHVEMRNFRSTLSRKVLIAKDGKVYSIGGKKSPQLLEACAAKYGRENVLNLLPLDKAFEVYTANA